MLTSNTEAPVRSTRSSWSPSPAGEILQARQAALASGQTLPPSLPDIPTNATIDQCPANGRLALDSEGGKIGFAYLPQAALGEYRDNFSFAFECQGRIWQTFVSLRTKDCGNATPRVSDVGAAPEKLVAGR